MRIYKTTDKLTYKIGELTIKVSPLSLYHKQNLHSFIQKGTEDHKAMLEGSVYALRAGLKEIIGLENEDGTPYKLEFENDIVSESCMDDLLNLEMSPKMVAICAQLLSGIPKVLPEGVTVVDNNDPNSQVQVN